MTDDDLTERLRRLPPFTLEAAHSSAGDLVRDLRAVGAGVLVGQAVTLLLAIEDLLQAREMLTRRRPTPGKE